MVSLRDLPYEFVFMRKPPSDPGKVTVSHQRVLPSDSQIESQRLVPKPLIITRVAKPATSVTMRKARLQISRGIRAKIRVAVRRRQYRHHEHNCHRREKEDWRTQYKVATSKVQTYTQSSSYLQSKEKMLSDFVSSNKLAYRPALFKYIARTEQRAQQRKERRKRR